jgi:hypothetical protein
VLVETVYLVPSVQQPVRVADLNPFALARYEPVLDQLAYDPAGIALIQTGG